MKLRAFSIKTARPTLWVGLAVLLFSSNAVAQWKDILDPPGEAVYGSVYFLNLPGPPRIGFVYGFDSATYATHNTSAMYKTTDGGHTWRTVPLGPWGDVAEMVFKDSMTGWVSDRGLGGIFKTTDQGNSWVQVSTVDVAASDFYYDRTNGSLFLSTWGNTWFPHSLIVSWDEGLTWQAISTSTVQGYNGFAFENDTSGIASTPFNGGLPGPWLRTNDAGKTWGSIPMDSECWQPLAISGTKTQFAITDLWGNVLRTDNLWDSSWVVYSFPVDTAHLQDGFTNGAILGDSNHLFVQMSTGVYMSTDEGKSWKYLCGIPYYAAGTPGIDLYDQRFYVRYPYISIVTRLPYNTFSRSISALWMLNVDSMQYFPTGIAFADGTKRATVQPGTPVTINYSPQTSDPIGIDTGHLVFHYDSNSLSLKSLKLPPSWIILDSSTSGGVLDLRIIDTTASQLPTPAVQLIFNTYLSSPSAKVYLDSADLSGHRLNCDCQALSIIGPDSVEIDFTGCGDSTILAAMEHAPPFRIESIVPNPAGASLRIEGNGQRVEVELDDAIGRTMLSPALYALSFTLDVSPLPSGTYFLRLSEGGYVQTRQVSIEH